MLKDEIEINQFEKKKRPKKSQFASTFETGDSSHEPGLTP
jgi:hypothetical protein